LVSFFRAVGLVIVKRNSSGRNNKLLPLSAEAAVALSTIRVLNYWETFYPSLARKSRRRNRVVPRLAVLGLEIG